MPKKIVIDVEEMEKPITVTMWMDMAHACGAMAQFMEVAGAPQRAQHFRTLQSRCEYRSMVLAEGRVVP